MFPFIIIIIIIIIIIVFLCRNIKTYRWHNEVYGNLMGKAIVGIQGGKCSYMLLLYYSHVFNSL